MTERSTERKPFGPRARQAVRIGMEVWGWQITVGMEMIRAALVNPVISPRRMFEGSTPPAALNPESPLFPILQNSGDFTDGYLIGMGVYNGLLLVDSIQGRFTHRYLPQRIKTSMTMLAVTGVVTLVESGILNGLSTTDWNDIPAGIAGGLAYLGVNYLARRVSSRPGLGVRP